MTTLQISNNTYPLAWYIDEQYNILMYYIYCKMPWANFLPYGSRSNMTTRWQLSLLRHYCILKVKGTDVNLTYKMITMQIVLWFTLHFSLLFLWNNNPVFCLSCVMMCLTRFKHKLLYSRYLFIIYDLLFKEYTDVSVQRLLIMLLEPWKKSIENLLACIIISYK